MPDLDQRALRDAFGGYVTGVTVVTARQTDGIPVGFTANSFASVSLDPPLLLVCPGKFLSSYQTFATCTHFAVSVLSAGQEDISDIFARSKMDRFAQVDHHSDIHGIPVITGATARFPCSTHHILPAGDHCVLMGRVRCFEHSAKPGLGYAAGQYVGVAGVPPAQHHPFERMQ